MHKVIPLACALLLASCAQMQESDSSGIRIVHRTPSEFCSGTARSVAVDRYNMKRNGMPLSKALEANNGVDVIDAITRAVYSRTLSSESQAGSAGTSACLNYFRNR